MLKIIICTQKKEEARALFELSTQIIRKLAVKCDLSYCTDFQNVYKNLTDNLYYYDIFILDALDSESINIAKKVRTKNLISSIIFTAQNSSQLLRVLKYRPSALLTDLEHANQLFDALKTACKEQLYINPYFIVKNKETVMRIHYDHIFYFESSQRIVTLYSKNQQIRFYAKLADVQSVLPSDKFIRCHQSYLINIDMVKKLDKANRNFHMISGEIIEISKSYYPQIQEDFSRKWHLKA